MSRPNPVRRALLAAAGATVLVGLAACSSGSGTPEGWTRVEDGWLQVDVPEAWVETGGLSDRWTASWQDAEGADATVQLAASPALGYYRAAEARGIILANAQVGGLPGFAVTSQSDPVDTDALEVTRTDFTYEPDDGGTSEGVLWVAADRETKKSVALQLTAAELDEDVVEQLEASIRVLDTEATPNG
ncbi:hypothetical protein [Cellulomonas sp. NS3]|uniref:hypothetical protein n=1 Tax=Cellulomonas sp. NS3 TaxID=2973977 RepID=UPI00216235EF|nr:hypothetical protein [Cellulomonas sp. NS3]